MHTRRLLVVGLLAVVGCSSSGASSTTSSGVSASATTAAARGSANVITQQEIAALGGSVQSALELVERLRPTMMRSRASTFGAPRSDGSQGGASINVRAYVDEVSLGDVAQLRSVPATQVKEIRYINATDATQRWGTGHGSGVIQVITKR